MKQELSEKINDSIMRLEAMGIWNQRMSNFLGKTMVMDFIEELIHESKKEVDEAILVFLAALRYLDIRYGANFEENTISDSSGRDINLELFLVQKHATLFELCILKKVQANIPARAFPILEHLSELGFSSYRVIELGCSAGLLGKVFLNAEAIVSRPQAYTISNQQIPKFVAKVESYYGYDIESADLTWVIACIHEPELRKAVIQLDKDFKENSRAHFIKDSALNFPFLKDLPQGKNGVTDVILTSYILYQLQINDKEKLINSILEYCTKNNAIWLNLDLRKNEAGKNVFFLANNLKEVFILEDDYCTTWKLK